MANPNQQRAPKAPKDVCVGVVCGLGNPGAEYEATRHNAGFRAIDVLARELGASYWKTKPGALVAEVVLAGRKVALVKPTAYMNVSGGPLKKIAEEYRVPAAGVLVIHDELELPAGAVAVKFGGGHAGHNGLRSIAEKFGTPDFPRVRCGIGRPPGRMAPANFVLQPMRGRDLEEFDVTVADAALAARVALEQGVAAALERFAAPKR
jgi:PTH1 family peptidyl-tRNA hydrolase